MKIWMTALLSLALTACINNPQTVDEFRSAAQAGGLNVHRETVTVQQPVDTVVGRLGRFADQCLRVQVRSSVTQGANVSSGTTTYKPSLRRDGDALATLVLQAVYSPKPVGSTMPPGGYFIALADMRPASGGTELTMAGGSAGHGALYDGIKQWARTGSGACPYDT